MSEDMNKCSKCEMNSSKSNFCKYFPTKNGLHLICKICRRGYYIKNHEKLNENRKEYNEHNRAKINIYEKNRRKIDLNFKLAYNRRLEFLKILNRKMLKI